MSGEFELIDWIRQTQRKSPLLELGIGDDLAALNWPAGELLLVGVDQVIDGVHFDSRVHSLNQIGRKAMNRNLSDYAAMGCLPAVAVVAAALRGFFTRSRQGTLRGIAPSRGRISMPNRRRRYGDVGGQTGPERHDPGPLGGGEAGHPGRSASRRRNFRDRLLGGSILGRHLTFEPRVKLGREIAPVATAMIDISDGLSRDLAHICKSSGVGAIVESGLVPIHPDAVELSRRDQISALDHALNDGEDYELLFTSRRRCSSGRPHWTNHFGAGDFYSGRRWGSASACAARVAAWDWTVVTPTSVLPLSTRGGGQGETAVSFVAERSDWIEAGCAAGGVEAEEDSDGGGKAQGKEHAG